MPLRQHPLFHACGRENQDRGLSLGEKWGHVRSALFLIRRDKPLLKAVAPETYTIDVSNESMIGGPQANPELAAKMEKVYNDVGLVLLRGQPDVGNDLNVGKQWVTVCMPHLAKYEGGANPRKGKGVDNVYEVGAPGVSLFFLSIFKPETTVFIILGLQNRCLTT